MADKVTVGSLIALKMHKVQMKEIHFPGFWFCSCVSCFPLFHLTAFILLFKDAVINHYLQWNVSLVLLLLIKHEVNKDAHH